MLDYISDLLEITRRLFTRAEDGDAQLRDYAARIESAAAGWQRERAERDTLHHRVERMECVVEAARELVAVGNYPSTLGFLDLADALAALDGEAGA